MIITVITNIVYTAKIFAMAKAGSIGEYQVHVTGYYLKPGAHGRIGRAAPAHDAFLRPIHSCAGDLAKQLASRAGGKIIRRVWYYQHRVSPILSSAGNMSC